MAAAKYKLKIEQGATLRQPFIWLAGGAPVNLTGWTGRMQIRQDVTSSIALATLSTANGGIVIDGPSGKFSMYMTAAQTAALSFDTAVYDLELVAVNGDVIRIIQGDVVLSPEVTRD